MHDRNIFKDKRPDFEKLALEYKQFAPYVQKGSSGKCFVNFKDPASLRALSVVLLKKYFNLSMEIPLDRLIPTVPLRLNYIHWIEDLMESVKDKEIVGIDVGCGPSCIYPLLGNKINKWKFIATEIDEESRKFAEDNVKQNNVGEFIKVFKVSKDNSPLSFVVKTADIEKFDFCMCNPPFFNEKCEEPKNRTAHRPAPGSISTASECESFTKGGEVKFVKKIIDDSLVIQGNITWYTSMLGKKASIKPIIQYLKEKNINNHGTTTFKQGKTMRWGVAWSFTETMTNKPSAEFAKKQKPIFLAPSDAFYQSNQMASMKEISTMEKESLSTVMLQLAQIVSKELTKLKITFDEPAQIFLGNRTAYEITGKAFENTWTHQRRKKRIEKFRDLHTSQNSNENILSSSPEVYASTQEDCNGESTEKTKKRKVCDTEADSCNESEGKRFCGVDTENLREGCSEKSTSNSDCSKQINEIGNPLFDFSFTIGQTSQFSLDNSDSIVFSFLCISGHRDLFHQLFTYFKNVFQGTQMNLKLHLY